MEEKDYMRLEELEGILSESGYIYLGHGIGRDKYSEEIVNSIFKEGLRIKDNSLLFTALKINTPSEETILRNKTLGFLRPSIEMIKKEFKNWPSIDSKKIIIIKLPVKYINNDGGYFDTNGETFRAFYREEIKNNKKVYYLDPKFIIGSYDVDDEIVYLNNNFDKSLSNMTIKELEERYRYARMITLERIGKMLKRDEFHDCLGSEDNICKKK